MKERQRSPGSETVHSINVKLHSADEKVYADSSIHNHLVTANPLDENEIVMGSAPVSVCVK